MPNQKPKSQESLKENLISLEEALTQIKELEKKVFEKEKEIKNLTEKLLLAATPNPSSNPPFKNFQDLPERIRKNLINAESAVLVWQQLSQKANNREDDKAFKKLKVVYKRYQNMCKEFNVAPKVQIDFKKRNNSSSQSTTS